MRSRLTGFGLTIASDCAIRGTRADDADAARAADIVVETLQPRSPHATPSPVYHWDGETLTFTAAGVARYRCRPGGITIAAETGADPELVEDLLIATALPAVLWLRGECVLHAAALVGSGGTALAIAGPSGVGKSTVVSQSIAGDGGAFLADDTVRLVRQGERICGSGLGGGYHLLGAVGAARAFRDAGTRPIADVMPIGAIAFLSRTAGPPSLRRLDTLGGVERLLADQHRPAIPALIGRAADTLAFFAYVAQHCEMYEWQRSSPILDAAERAMLSRDGLKEWVPS